MSDLLYAVFWVSVGACLGVCLASWLIAWLSKQIGPRF